MMDKKVYIASAFSLDDQGGNKAGVVFDYEKQLSTKQKMSISKSLGYAETAFISNSNIADFKFEYFTPKEEVALCGHATIASFIILMHLNNVSENDFKTIETKSGVLTVNITNGCVLMEQNCPKFYDEIPIQKLAQCFDVSSIETVNGPIQIVSTGLKDILVPIISIKALNEIKPNFKAIKEVSQEYNVIGTHLFAIEKDRVVCRNFAPLYDIDEESATGTSNAALASYLHKYGQTFQNCDEISMSFEQGYSLNSPSKIDVNLKLTSNKIEKVYVGGNGYLVSKMNMSVD